MKIPHLKLESLACTTLTLLVAIGCGEDPKPQSESRLPLAPGATPGANLPRPTPSETLDPISARVIGRRAILLLDEPNAATWTNYADACLMNLWPEEAVFAYRQALALPGVKVASTRWRLARALQDLGSHEEAETEAMAALELVPGYASGWVELARRRLDNGDLEGARAALQRADPEKTGLLSHAVVSIPLDLQSGRMQKAKKTLDALLLESADRNTNRLAVMVGQAMNDQDLVARHLPNASKGLLRFDDPWIGSLAPLARHERADLVRAISLREGLPPQKALNQVRMMIKDRPELPMLRVVAAGILKDTGRIGQAKIALDSVHDLDPSDHEYWAMDALVHLKLAQLGDTDLLERSRISGDRAIQINPKIGYGWEIRGNIHEEDSEWLEAASAFDLAAEHAETEDDRNRNLAKAVRCRQMVENP